MSYETILNMLTGIIMLFLITSVGVNFMLWWYISKLNEKLKYAVQRHSEISTEVKTFIEHIDTVNKMELYSGDEVLVNLLKHSRAVAEEIEDYTNMIVEEDSDGEEEG